MIIVPISSHFLSWHKQQVFTPQLPFAALVQATCDSRSPERRSCAQFAPVPLYCQRRGALPAGFLKWRYPKSSKSLDQFSIEIHRWLGDCPFQEFPWYGKKPVLPENFTLGTDLAGRSLKSRWLWLAWAPVWLHGGQLHRTGMIRWQFSTVWWWTQEITKVHQFEAGNYRFLGQRVLPDLGTPKRRFYHD